MYIESGIFIFLLLTGMCVGSFLNVVIYRIPKSLMDSGDEIFNIAWPPSHCTKCDNKILKRDNIPVISFFLLKGKCRFCGSVISSRYPLIEFITGISFSIIGLWMIVYLKQEPIEVISVLFLFSVLLCLAVIDLDHLLLPDCLVFTLLWTGLLISCLELSPVSLQDAVIGICGVWIILSMIVQIFILIRKKEGLGAGDIKLICALTAWIGWHNVPILLVFSAIIGGVMFINVKRRFDCGYDGSIKNCHVIPFGPAISISGFVIYLFIANGYDVL
ncbi:prepilin peptidase [Escherichia coli]|uniref:prepilin peptidase n=2 Tax=Escherichia coli TaxID=562 RepID=UPI0002C953E6|nr:A24 family peptidase [Escherichia coli]EFH3247403.1 prepilin peptidase [Escherichia coli]EMU73036.1 type IV leader peptidase family protein [Escherichia coli MP021017.9]EMU74171.1 type IV leader peptidase family protein [Escherichia coli MP021017.6]EMU75584.1 type IV leader peptidase family protein [Escherichia coli MP021017.5]EMU89538.1 type IV leader peptidase family protein [Escherichia coli MP021017.2]